ncbi:protein tramtrack, beta isoform-like [Schistocerca gregaria]|uniref:protein tramtrack, beta isoform-like n=1 Tax=Schistocerca gregaria TaxID=7010 RepID=UPI00211F26CD|nr:protein tramtrack, beta isoform-like [Schistocerca gregaria]
MGGERLLVQWEQHESAVLAHLRRLLAAEAFVDVTLYCQGHRLRAHRVLLSACSPYLQRMLLEHPCGAGESVTVILHDVSHEDMRRLLDLIYTGSTEVPGHHLSRFLCTAKALDLTLLQSAALRICEVAASPTAGTERGPTPPTTLVVPSSFPETTSVPSPKKPSLPHGQSLLMAPQLGDPDSADHLLQALSAGPPIPPPACQSPLTPSCPLPTTAHSSTQGAGQPTTQVQLLKNYHFLAPPPTVTVMGKSPWTTSVSQHIQPWMPPDDRPEQPYDVRIKDGQSGGTGGVGMAARSVGPICMGSACAAKPSGTAHVLRTPVQGLYGR